MPLNQKVQELFSNATGGTAYNCSINLSYLPQKGKYAQLPLGNFICSTLTPEHIHFERATAYWGKIIQDYFNRLICLRLISLTLKNLYTWVSGVYPELLQHETLIHLPIPHLSVPKGPPRESPALPTEVLPSQEPTEMTPTEVPTEMSPREEPTEMTPSKRPADCDPHLAFDAITTLRGEILFFKDRWFLF